MGGGSLTGGASANIVFGGSGAGTTLPAVALNNLTVNRANGIALNPSVTVNGTLTLTNGAVTGGGNLTLGNSAAITVAAGSLDAAPNFRDLAQFDVCRFRPVWPAGRNFR